MGLEMEITGSDGRRYDGLAEMVEAEGTRLIDDHVAAVERAIESQRCPVHGSRPTLTRTRRGDEISFEITGCCEELVEKAQAAAARVK